jgi:Phosphotransferase enzyme family
MGDAIGSRYATVEVDSSTLTALVQKATGKSCAQVTEWTSHPILTGAGEGLGLFHYSGAATDGNDVLEWSLILKALGGQRQGGDSPADWNCWLREPLAYQSGLLNDLPGGIRAPRCYDLVQRPNGNVWLWLEDMTDGGRADVIGEWTLDDYGQVARDFGRLNGAYLTGRPLPAGPWVSQHWLRDWIDKSADSIALLRQSQDNPWIMRTCPSDIAEAIFRMWGQREEYLHALERLPQTFCHMDVFRRNLMLRARPDGRRETVALDWAFSGQGALGEELAPLIVAGPFFMEVPVSLALEVEERAFAGYLEGLRDAGWSGDARQARLGYAIAGATRYAVGAWKLTLPVLLDERLHFLADQVFGHPMGEVCDITAQANSLFTLRLEREARDLMSQLM